MKIIIAGGRDFNDYNYLKEKCDFLLAFSETSNLEIVSGGCSGADSLGELYAKEKGIKLKIFEANWEKYGRAAGPIRNAQMAEYSDFLILFWDRKSKGSLSMIKEADLAGVPCQIYEY